MIAMIQKIINMPRYKRRDTLKTLVTSYEDCPVEISKEKYLDITEGFMQFISDKLLNGEEIDLPLKQGTLMVAGRKQQIRVDSETGNIKGVTVDWKKTLLLWKENPEAKLMKKRIYHFNEHTNGNRYKIFWLNGYANMKNKSLMYFKATRHNSRELWKKLMENKEYKLLQPINFDKNKHYKEYYSNKE